MNLLHSFRHPSDEALLLLDQGDLPVRGSRSVRSHLLTCPACRSRLRKLQQQERELRSTFPLDRLPPAEAARVRLQESLRASAEESFRSPRLTFWNAAHLRPHILLRASAVAMLLVLAVVTYRQASRPLQDLMGVYEDTGPEPDRVLTPGSAAMLTVAEVCRQNDDDLDPKLSPEQQRAVFAAYRLDERAAKAYQVDYLINPQLGGDSTPANLWPEPYHATVWNATAKDALETRLHGLVCSGQLDLQTAQRELATDWIGAYKKYFHASRPVNTVAKLETVAQP